MDKDTLAPGPALDAAVAAALGWDEATIAALVPVIHFSTRIEDAWRVVERLAADGWDIEIGYDAVDCSWVASFMKGEKWGVSTVKVGPHAISLAALAALEGDK